MEIQTLRFVQSLPKRQRVPFSEKLRCNDESALDLLEKMLVFDPRKRINASECLSHEYVAPYHDPTDEPVAAEKFDWSFNDADLPVDTWKVMMYAEILGAYRLSASGISGALTKACIDFHEVTTDPAASNGAVPEGALTGPDDGYAAAAARAPAAVAGSAANSTTTATSSTTINNTNTTAPAAPAAPAASTAVAATAK
jgi:p38 MAP kinase